MHPSPSRFTLSAQQGVQVPAHIECIEVLPIVAKQAFLDARAASSVPKLDFKPQQMLQHGHNQVCILLKSCGSQDVQLEACYMLDIVRSRGVPDIVLHRALTRLQPCEPQFVPHLLL